MKVNSSLGASCGDLANFGRSQTISLVSRPKFAKNSTTSTANTRIVLNADSTDSSLREFALANSWQSKQNNRASAHRISPDSWCKKSESKGAVVPPADFLLESDKRGSPPKSEKRQLLGTQFKYLGGAEAMGAALLRKETNESKSKKIVGDSRIAKIDCFDSALPNLAMTKKSAKLPKNNAFFSNAIAITGGIATGKSTACNILKLHGYSIIDTDSIAHEALEQSKDEVVGAFGTEILECESSESSADSRDSSKDSRESKINRKKLGAIVFNDKAKLATLESILHPKIRVEVKKQAQKLEAQGILYFIDIPLFFELQTKGNGYEIPRALLIYAPKELQLSRMQKRDNLSADEAQTRLANQMDIETKRQMADFVIENTGNIRDLQSKIEAFLKQIN